MRNTQNSQPSQPSQSSQSVQPIQPFLSPKGRLKTQLSGTVSTHKTNSSVEQPSMGRIFSDICMLLAFAVMVPTSLWLGNAAGF